MAKKVKKTKTSHPNKKTFMQWSIVGPLSYIAIGIILIFAGIYGIAKPDTFMGDGMANYITTIVVFFGLGALLIVWGYRIKTGKTQMPKLRFFSNK